MNFKFNKKKLSYVVFISFFAALACLYMFNPAALQKADAAEGELRTIDPQAIFYVFVFFVVLFLFWLIVLYVVLSLVEEK